jgi:ribosomal protein S18 acetylase RimI-like enzyme
MEKTTMADTLPDGFQLRPPTMKDVVSVTQLINTLEIAQYGSPEMTQDDIYTEWQSPEFDFAHDAWVVIAPDGQLVSYAAVWHREHVRIWTEVNVHPDYEGYGIGEHLLHLAEQWARRHVDEAPHHARVSLMSGVSSLDNAQRQRLERAGYTLVRRSWRMEIEMNEPPSVLPWPEDISVRPFVRGQDERTVFNTDEEAFHDHWGHIPIEFELWEYWTVKRESFDPSLWFLAFDGNQPAGICLCRKEKDTGWVDTLAVLRPWRRRGLGMSLLLHAFAEFYQRGMRKVGLSVDSENLTGATRLYERAGMHVARQYERYEKELRPGVELSVQSITV